MSFLGHDDFFINGNINYSDNNYKATINIYNTKSFKKVSTDKFSNNDIFSLIDDILYSGDNAFIILN